MNICTVFLQSIETAGSPGSPPAFAILAFGFLLGLKHALDADHLIAISTIVGERRGFFSSALVGAWWGFGHTLALLAVGGSLILLGIQLPDRVALFLELGVAAMLVYLGTNVLVQIARGGKVHLHIHSHGGHTHAHAHLHPATELQHHGAESSHHGLSPASFLHRFKHHVGKGKRSMLIGMVHGMAGSAGLMLVVLATISSSWLAFSYIAVFGVGSIGGMLIMSTLIGMPFALTAGTSERLNRLVRGISGALSVVFGVLLAWHIGVVEGLFF